LVRPIHVEVVAEGQDGRSFLCGQCFRAGGFAAGQFGVGKVAECGFPGGFQAAGDETVVRVDGLVSTFGFGCGVACAFDLASPLGERGVVAVFEFLGGGQAGLQGGRGERGEEPTVTASSSSAPCSTRSTSPSTAKPPKPTSSCGGRAARSAS
jgi:hypothetical protein